MIGLVGQQLAALVAMALLMGLPGWAAGRLLQVQLVLPAALMPPAWFALGLGVWSIPASVCLGAGWPVRVALSAHAGITLVLLAVTRHRERTRGHAKRGGGQLELWTVVGIVLCALLAAMMRTRMAFDTLFHVGLVRRLAELPHPTFANVDRIVGAGVNPAYLAPVWQDAMAAVSQLTGLDPATVVESMAALIVMLAAFAAAGLGRVAGGGRASCEVAGVAAYGWMRIWFPRRELEGDGIAYAFVPGNLAVDVLLPLLLATLVLLASRGMPRVHRMGSTVLLAVASALFVVLHANYVVYLAVMGIGGLAWLAAAGPWTRDVRRRTLVSCAAVGLPAVLVFAAVLPALLLLDHFGSPAEVRIDYHLVGSGWREMLRPSYLYDTFGAPGLLAILAAPLAVWRMRGVARAVIGGGLFALVAVALVPPLLHLMDQTGSRTLALRMQRPIGVLLVACAAVALPAVVAAVRGVANRVRERRGRVAAWLVAVAPFVVAGGLAAAYGYPRAKNIPPDYGWRWPGVAGAIGLLVVFVLAVRQRRATNAVDIDTERATEREEATAEAAPRTKAMQGRRSEVALVGVSVLALSLAMLPVGGIISLRRGAWQGKQLVASYRADDLGCEAGIQSELRKLPPGGAFLADPVTSYDIQALAPRRSVADYKTWNGTTDTSRSHERIEQIRDAFDEEDPIRASRAALRLAREHDAAYLIVADGEIEPPQGSTIGSFDASGLREALANGTLPAQLLASGRGNLPSGATDEQRAACDLSLWEIENPRDDVDVQFLARYEGLRTPPANLLTDPRFGYGTSPTGRPSTVRIER